MPWTTTDEFNAIPITQDILQPHFKTVGYSTNSFITVEAWLPLPILPVYKTQIINQHYSAVVTLIYYGPQNQCIKRFHYIMYCVQHIIFTWFTTSSKWVSFTRVISLWYLCGISLLISHVISRHSWCDISFDELCSEILFWCCGIMLTNQRIFLLLFFVPAL